MMSAIARHPHASFLPPRAHSPNDIHSTLPKQHHSYAFATTSLPPSYDAQHLSALPVTTFAVPEAPSIFDHNDFRARPFPQQSYRHDSSAPASNSTSTHDWATYPTSMGTPTNPHFIGLKGARTHIRTPSSSTVASSGPLSPFNHNSAFPQIANPEFAPAYQSDAFSKHPNTLGDNSSTFPLQAYDPSHRAMTAFAIDYSTTDELAVPDFSDSARHSMSSYGNDSPATPPAAPVENGDKNNGNEVKRSNGHIQLFRTESQAYQDELYNPPTTYSSTPVTTQPTTTSTYLSPHRNLISERLQTANLARSQSPTSNVAREVSPFRDNSPYVPAGEWRGAIGTAAGMRQQQKDLADQAEYAQHMPQLQREPTKTISPKDAVLDYTGPAQPSLFQDNVPQGYRQHNTGTGTEAWPGTSALPHPDAGFLQTGYTDASFPNDNSYTFGSLPATSSFEPSNIPAVAYQNNAFNASKTGQFLSASDGNPPFPATLNSMDSSISDNPPSSSNDDPTLMLQKPADTRANTGTYTCTYHGCTQRFESHAGLQKHKREFHRSQNQHAQRELSEPVSQATGSSSPRSSVSPAPSGSGMTSAALQARNSQAGPHKCSRINPQTGKPCNTIFSRPYDLTRHEDTIHNGRKQKVRCPMCREEKTFSRNDALTRHMRVVHPEVENFGKRAR